MINVTVNSIDDVTIQKPVFADKVENAPTPPTLDTREVFFTRRRSQRDWKPAIIDAHSNHNSSNNSVSSSIVTTPTPPRTDGSETTDRWDGSMPRRHSSRSFIERNKSQIARILMPI